MSQALNVRQISRQQAHSACLSADRHSQCACGWHSMAQAGVWLRGTEEDQLAQATAPSHGHTMAPFGGHGVSCTWSQASREPGTLLCSVLFLLRDLCPWPGMETLLLGHLAPLLPCSGPSCPRSQLTVAVTRWGRCIGTTLGS